MLLYAVFRRVNMYDLNKDNFEHRFTNNQIMNYLGNACYQYGKMLQSISISMTRPDSILGIDDGTGKTVLTGIYQYYTEMGYVIDTNSKESMFAMVVDYFLRAGLCYVEVEGDSVNQNGKYSAVKQKFISTKNNLIVSDILGVSVLDVDSIYERNLDLDNYDLKNCTIPYLKISWEDRKITKCNKNLNTQAIRLTSLPLLQYWLMGLAETMQTQLVKFTFLKDDNSERSIVTTLNPAIISQTYDMQVTNNMVNKCKQTGNVDGRIWTPFTGNILRGWIRVPEMGSSIVDDDGTRAINISRIVKLESVTDFDKTFINVSLDGVIPTMENKIDELHAKNMYSGMVNLYVALQKYGFRQLQKPVQSYQNVNGIADVLRGFMKSNQYTGTPFKRALHKFMVSNVELFPNYIGEKVKVEKKINYGVATMDF